MSIMQLKSRISDLATVDDANATIIRPSFIRVKWLDFWLACRALDGLDEAKDGDGVKAHLGRMSKDFFGASSGVSLTNDSVRRECAQICSRGKLGSDLRPMWLAQGRSSMSRY